ncbi:type I secretion protein TolC [Endozoicomonas sp. OPT23]|uniref:TolC family outer membrane protein n=1 Tax=Endozoicomonas sp. OPT23 TaxID=2072845 RepID=UPI00129B76B5|nr:TolC family outer membrane protein [Endozoicomonas sp. OPT23]MRI34140.1 type I secretion protein TolC [Endozoicomonas sp. OPT23]
MATTAVRGLSVAVALATLQISGNANAGSLVESVNLALASNPEIAIRTSEASARRDEVRQAEAGYLPRVDLSAGIGFEDSRNATTLNDSDLKDKHAQRTRREGAITLRQMLFDGLRTKSAISQQAARHASAKADVCFISEDIALQAAQAYINVLRARRLVENGRVNLDNHERVVEKVRKKAKSGLGSDADLVQAQGRLVLAQANLISLEAAQGDAEAVYRKTVGNLPDSFDHPTSPSTVPGDLDVAMETAAGNHPGLKLAAADVEAAEALYKSSKSAYYPTFTAELGATWGKDQEGSKGTINDTTAMLRMNYNLYNGGADKARKSQTANLLNEAIEVKNRTHRQVDEEVRLAWVAVTFGQNRLDALAAHVRSAERTRDYYNQQFDLGTRTLLDLLDSQNEFFTAQSAYTNGQNDLMYNQYRLLRSTGSLLSSLNARLPNQAAHCM